MLDGAGTWQVLTRVIVPLARPGLAVTAILTWVFAWNEYLFAATLTSVEARTITTGLAEFVTVTGTNWGEMAAVATLTLLPAVIFLGVVQRHIVAGHLRRAEGVSGGMAEPNGDPIARSRSASTGGASSPSARTPSTARSSRSCSSSPSTCSGCALWKHSSRSTSRPRCRSRWAT